jgi:hypothetical protein
MKQRKYTFYSKYMLSTHALDSEKMRNEGVKTDLLIILSTINIPRLKEAPEHQMFLINRTFRTLYPNLDTAHTTSFASQSAVHKSAEPALPAECKCSQDPKAICICIRSEKPCSRSPALTQKSFVHPVS